jgi:hypothetical protein
MKLVAKLRSRRSLAMAAAVVAAVLAWTGCDDEDEIEPGEAVILSVEFNPGVVCLGATSAVTVTLTDQAGDPIVGEDITLAVTPATGSLADCVATPCATDASGEVSTTFTASAAGTHTVTATGGTITSQAPVSVVAAGTGTLTLLPAETDFTECIPTRVDTLPVSGVRLDGGGAPISGAVMTLETVASPDGLAVSFLTTPVVTASDGTYSALLILDESTCPPCDDDLPGCTITVRAVSDCSVVSGDVVLTESF